MHTIGVWQSADSQTGGASCYARTSNIGMCHAATMTGVIVLLVLVLTQNGGLRLMTAVPGSFRNLGDLVATRHLWRPQLPVSLRLHVWRMHRAMAVTTALNPHISCLLALWLFPAAGRAGFCERCVFASACCIQRLKCCRKRRRVSIRSGDVLCGCKRGGGGLQAMQLLLLLLLLC
jgi:hypothetical protein